jgi:hypothetical protein
VQLLEGRQIFFLDIFVLFISIIFMASVDGEVGGQLDALQPERNGVQAP